MQRKAEQPPGYVNHPYDNQGYMLPHGDNYPQGSNSSPPPYSPPYPKEPPPFTVAQYYAQNQQRPACAVVVQQPQQDRLEVTEVPDHTVLAVFITFCCCLPLGICALLKASESRSALAKNDVGRATVLAAESRRLSMMGLGIGICVLILAFTVFVVAYLKLVQMANTYY